MDNMDLQFTYGVYFTRSAGLKPLKGVSELVEMMILSA